MLGGLSGNTYEKGEKLKNSVKVLEQLRLSEILFDEIIKLNAAVSIYKF
jgi:hypothetical protein